MRRLPILAASLVISLQVHAEPPSRTSLETLFEVTHTSSLVDSTLQQMPKAMEAGIEQAEASENGGKPLSPQQQALAHQILESTMAQVRQEFTWDKLEPIFIRIYTEQLDQADVDGLIAFYQTPAGQHFITKMPVILQQSMIASQELLKGVMPRIMQAAQAQIKASHNAQ
jgi:hypothetical protein